MKKLTITLCLSFAVLLGSIGSSSALPPCPSSGYWNNCFGTRTFSNGYKYVGEWKDGKHHGQGTIFRLYNKYVGGWKNGKHHGQGTMTFTNESKWVGDKYTGEWRDGNRNGQGTYTHANGNKYVGESRNNKRHGQGTFTFADGRIREGIWENGKFQYAHKVTPPSVAAEKRESEATENILKSRYIQYITIKECHDTSNQYISHTQMSAAKSLMKGIENYLMNKNKSMDTVLVWQSASREWETDMRGGFKVFQMLGTYSDDLNGICKIQFMDLSSVKIPGASNELRKKDF